MSPVVVVVAVGDDVLVTDVMDGVAGVDRDADVRSVATDSGRVSRELEFVGVATERLEAEACGLASAVAAVTCRWLLVVGELDRREVWRSWGCRGMAHWLSWKCGTSLVTARQHLEVARRLPELPVVCERFAAGTLSFSKVRALCRYATPLNEAELVVVADSATAAGLERILGAIDRVLADRSLDPAERGYRRRGVVFGRAGADGTVPVRIIATKEMAAGLRARLDEYEAQVPDECVESADDQAAARRHDALQRLVEGPEPAQLVVNLHANLADIDTINAIDDAAPSPRPPEDDAAESPRPPERDAAESPRPPEDDAAESSRGGSVGSWSLDRFGTMPVPADVLAATRISEPISSAMAVLIRRIGCDARARFVIDDHGASIDLGRTSRDPSRPLRRYVLQRDQYQCRVPGCHHKAEHVHHIRAWTDGGPTDRANLVGVCRYHHRLLHHDGFWLSGDPERPDGLELHHGERGRLAGERPPVLEPNQIDPRTFVDDPTGHGVDTRHYHGPMDLHHVVSVLLQLIPDPKPETALAA